MSALLGPKTNAANVFADLAHFSLPWMLIYCFVLKHEMRLSSFTSGCH